MKYTVMKMSKPQTGYLKRLHRQGSGKINHKTFKIRYLFKEKTEQLGNILENIKIDSFLEIAIGIVGKDRQFHTWRVNRWFSSYTVVLKVD